MTDLKIKKLLEKAKKIALFGHVHPDGDCIGSMLGLGALLEKQGKKVNYFIPTQPSKVFGFLPGIKKIKTTFDYGKYDVLVFVDFSEVSRFSLTPNPSPAERGALAQETKMKKYLDQASILIIDHHLADGPQHALVIKDVDSMSTSEIIFEHAYVWRPKLFDAQIATYLYMGLTMDSGNFVYDEHHERILSNALDLVRLGADKGLIVDQLIRKKSLNVIRFTQLLLGRMAQKGALLYTYYEDKELKKYGIDHEEADYPLTIIQNIDGPKLVLILKKIDDKVRCSLRSKYVKGKLVDCNSIAKYFGGGGHIPAAGFTVSVAGDFEVQVKKIVKEIVKMIK